MTVRPFSSVWSLVEKQASSGRRASGSSKAPPGHADDLGVRGRLARLTRLAILAPPVSITSPARPFWRMIP